MSSQAVILQLASYISTCTHGVSNHNIIVVIAGSHGNCIVVKFCNYLVSKLGTDLTNIVILSTKMGKFMNLLFQQGS